ncbi:MAG: NRDE family protein [Gammaproteobacteria bacterium]|nr:NRDE family protein [Gammaproteobacteria bacterium]
MCLILLGVNPDADHRLVVAANRDEFYARPTARAAWWDHAPDVLGGRDLKAGGTWLGVTRGGRFAAVTNFREEPPDPLPPRSRGALTADFLTSRTSPADYLEQIRPIADEFRGFNLIVADPATVLYFSNRDEQVRELTSGFYGLSNQLLNCNWPKVNRGRKQLSRLGESGFDADDLFSLIFCDGDGEPYSQSFIATETYGTSASTVVRIANDGDVYFEERNFGPEGTPDAIYTFEFNVA